MRFLLHCTLLVATLALLTGCVPLFVAVGAGTGYLVADQESRQKVDHFFRDLNRSIKKTTRKLQGDQRTGKQLSSHKATGFMLTIQHDALSPTTVHPGERVNVSLQYAITGAPPAGVRVTKQQILFFEGSQLTVINNEATTKKNGTWENTLAFAVPQSAQPGTYTVTQKISAQGLTRTTRRSFTVL